MEYTIWCDESISKGPLFSNFYGGVIAKSTDIPTITNAIKDKKQELNLLGEVKWTKVTENYREKYTALMSLFFRFVAAGTIKVRIMFRQNCFHPQGLTQEQRDNQFHLLYYQFIKHAFGVKFAPIHAEKASLRINFDKLPDKEDKNSVFKNFIYGLNREINCKNIFLPKDNISEVVSHDHNILQCLDVVLGSIAFKLNKLDRIKDSSTGKRGKKTVAKDNLYSFIYSEIRNLYPGYCFNIGINTGKREGDDSHWTMPYRHWNFVPSNHVVIPTPRG
jgi:hypothetical protein